MIVLGISIGGGEIIKPPLSNYIFSYGDPMNTLLEKIISTIEKREHWTTSELVAELRSHHEIRATASRLAPDSEVLAPGEHASPPSLRDGFRPEDD